MQNVFELPELPAVKDKNKQTPGSATRDDGRPAAASRQGEEGAADPRTAATSASFWHTLLSCE